MVRPSCGDLQAPSGWFGTFLFAEGVDEHPWEDDCDQQNAEFQQLQLFNTKVLVGCHIFLRPTWAGLTLKNSLSLGFLWVTSTMIRDIAIAATIIQPQLSTRSICNRSRASELWPHSPSIRSSIYIKGKGTKLFKLNLSLSRTFLVISLELFSYYGYS